MDDRDRFEQGMKTRREVLGSAHVDRSLVNLTHFNKDFQDFITRFAWGEIWSRPGLSRHTRSLITLAIMTALNREEEFKMHVRASFNNGVTHAEIKEVLLHAAIYCGLPSSNCAFQWAQQVLSEQENPKEPTASTEAD